MQTLSEIRQLLAERGMRPKHRLGQNFLHDKNQLERLLNAANVKPGNLVLEVGPGTGTLTEALLERGAEVIACEVDPAMADIVATRLDEQSHLHLIVGDALQRRRLSPQIMAALAGREFKLVANLPYQIASPLISALLTDHHVRGCAGLFITIQKEVADRLLAEPSTKAYGPLTIIVQALADVELIGTLSPSCFWPPPEVTSAMVQVIPRSSQFTGEARDFARFVVDLFTKRRKQLGTIFGRKRTDWPEGVTPNQRPEELTVGQLIALWCWHEGVSG
jgi:16S rRNA (adenine1518-N6/adenine1519-N6)-dimethyltransferase